MKSSLPLKVIFFLLVLLRAGVCLASPTSYAPELLSAQQWNQLGSMVIEALSDTRDRKTAGSVIIQSDLGFDHPGRMLFFISQSDGASPARVICAEGRSLNAVFSAALVGMAAMKVPAERGDFVKMHLGKNIIDLGIFNEFVRYRIAAGHQGFAVADAGGKVIYALLPEEIWANDLMRTGGKIDVSATAAYLDRTGRDGRQFRMLHDGAKARLLRFDVEARFHDGRTLHEIYRGHRLYPRLTETVVETSLALAGKYLAGIVADEGRFLYLYRPAAEDAADEYNIVRHAGTVYAMMELYQHDGNAETLASAGKAIAYLREATRPCPPPDRKALCVVEDGSTKLGANALTAVALAKYTEATGDRRHLEWMNGLCRRMISIQKKTGEFALHKQVWPGGEEPIPFVSSYYPGEAILALTRVYSHDRKAQWLEAADAAATWLITVRDADRTPDRLDHDHWLLYGLNELHRFRRKNLYLDHAKRIVDVIVAAQNLEADYPDWIGGYGYRPKSTQAATRTEGLMAAWELFSAAGETHYAQKALMAAELGVRFQLATQVREEMAMYFPAPARVLGGFFMSFDNHEIQIDNVQHNVSGILMLLKAYRSAKEAVR